MPLDRFVLILICVVAAAGATLWLGGMLAATLNVPALGVILVPVLLALYLLWRVLRDRLESSEDDHYDRIEK